MSNFQPARPAPRRPQAEVPDGARPVGKQPPRQRRGRPGGPQAAIPEQYTGARGPASSPGMIALMLLVLGVARLAGLPESPGAIVFGVLATVIGAVGCWCWVQAWRAWRRAWSSQWRWWSRPAEKLVVPAWLTRWKWWT